jgi:hypothetical protein
MVEGAALGALADLVDKASDYIEYWREHKGEEVVIREHSIRPGLEKRGKIQQTSYITKGTVSKVLSLPPGFVLEDVEEVVAVSDFSMMFGAGSTKPQAISPTTEGEQVVREVDEKFVAFSAIEELESAEDANNAKEPFRE